MKLKDLFDADGAEDWADTDVTGVTADSREVKPGYLFAAIPGEKANGAQFISDAIARGAAAILAPEGLVKPANTEVRYIHDANLRRRFAVIAGKFHSGQPKTIVAVTGTNGKTSVASFVRQIWEALGRKAASLGTVGVVSPLGEKPLAHTTPDPAALHVMLAELADGGVEALALEASSHGLEQHRLDGVRLAAGAFTNITRDHLDYHRTFEAYLAAKLRLFDLLAPDAPAVINADHLYAAEIAGAAEARRLDVFTVGRLGLGLKFVSAEPDGLSQRLTVRYAGKTYRITLPLAGDFQASNALVAAALVLKTGGDPDKVFAALEILKGAKGRLELAGRTAVGAPVFIDYAHTPDALEKALETLRPYATGKLAVVFGCGGDRDRGKRPQMGAAASRLADKVYVTDDNPRSEDAASIRAAILAEAPGAREIGDRAQAIAEAVAALGSGDVLLVAGKGHETGQIMGDKIIPFSDHDAVRAALGGALPVKTDAAPAQPEPEPAKRAIPPIAAKAPEYAAILKLQAAPLTGNDAAQADAMARDATRGAEAFSTPDASGPLPTSSEALPTPASEEKVVSADANPAIETSTDKAPAPDAATAHEVMAPAQHAAIPDTVSASPLWTFDEVLKAIKGAAQGTGPDAITGVSIDSRTLAPGDLFVAIKGERVDGHEYVTKALAQEAAAAIVVKDYFGAAGPLVRVPDPLEALNNLARAARARTDAKVIAVTGSAGKTSSKEMLRLALSGQGATHASEKSYNNLWGVPLSLARMPRETKFGVFEIGMNHAGEITPLTRLTRPHVAIVTTVAAVHLEFFASVEGIAEAKAEIFLGLEPGGVAIINRDIRYFALLERRAKAAGAGRVVSFGEYPSADARLVRAELLADRSRVEASILGQTVKYEVGAPGKHLVMNSLAVLAAVHCVGGDMKLAAERLAAFETPEGRGARAKVPFGGGEILLIDESYNANPASMRAAFAVLASTPRGEHPRRVAVLGDMLELGHASEQLHRDLAPAIDEAEIDVVFACGPQMRALFDALRAEKRGAYAATAEELQPVLIAALKPGDAVMIKGSLGSRTGALVKALKSQAVSTAQE
jgi:UDP-N-acetylmuramoyl-L-alanyl-D-glutamate--2,6-diaminopimelate ligase